MPNHIKNVWKIKNIKPDQLDYILNKITAEYNDTDLGTTERIIDFDLIIPEPRLKRDCPKECLVNKYRHVMKYKERPWFDWYAWRLAYWGTKWNAYSGYTKIESTQITLVFNTTWSFPERVAIRLINLLSPCDYNFEFRYADEDYGVNCGKISYCSHTGELKNLTSEIKDPRGFAIRLWNNY